MWISCWNCGQDVWLETQKQCRHCDAFIHRCADCDSCDSSRWFCDALLIELDPEEAQTPTRLSLSINCTDFRMSEQAMQRPVGTAAEPKAAPTSPADRAAAPAPETTASAAGHARELADAEVITIRREPALKRPKHPLVIAHRGDSGSAPENTVSALKSAVAAGAHGVEFDVHLTADGQAVVLHDATVERCSNGRGAVCDMTLEQVRALDAGGWFAEPFEGERIPTLDEAIDAIPAPTVLFIHLRDHENESDRCERIVADAAEHHRIHKRAVVTHHTRHGLQRLREMAPQLRLCWIPYGGEPVEEYVDDVYYLGCRFIQPLAKELNEQLVKYAHDRGMWINAFWADEITEMEQIIRLGVDSIMTNYPRRLRELLKEFS